MKMKFIFCHGWGLDHRFFESMASGQPHCSLDLGYFGKTNLDIPKEDTEYIGIGHSLGLIKLLDLNIKFKALIGVHSFINFLGFEENLRKKRIKEWKRMIQNFEKDPIETILSFYKRCGISTYCPHKKMNKENLKIDLECLSKVYNLPSHLPTLILGSKNDIIVPEELIYDNFSNYKNVKIVMHDKKYHSLPLHDPHFVHKQIKIFLDVL